MDENKISNVAIGCAIRVHNSLGPGLLESAYKECLFFELAAAGLIVEKEKPIPLMYQNIKMECGYRMDLLVNEKVVIELKTVDALNEVHLAQMLTYLRLGNHKLGLLINFNVIKLKDGIRRVVNGL